MDALKAVFAYINAPLFECMVSENLFDLGIGHVVVAKMGRTGILGVGAFLLDVYCLGVKDAFFHVCDETEYRERILSRMTRNQKFVPMEGACARTLIEGAVEYARKLGIPPHKDYRLASKLLLNLNSADCSTEFEYGRDGKPLFVAGPNDGPGKCDRILELLRQKCGPDGYNYILPVQDYGEESPSEEDEDDPFES